MTRIRPTDERGIALIIALMVMTVLSITITTAIVATTQGQHEAHQSKAKNYAYILAENGINNAMSVLRDPPDAVTGIGNNALDPNVFCGLALPTGWSYSPSNSCNIRSDYDGGYDIFTATLTPATSTWTVVSTGYVTSPVANTGQQTRTLTVQVPVHPTLTQPLNTPVWNYIYSTKGPSAPPTCDMDLNQSVTISSPLYVEGNLCLHNSSAITKGPLVVKGRLIMDSNTQNYAGTSAVPLSDAHIFNGCTVKTTTHTPCRSGGVDNLYATVLDQSVPAGINPPVPNWDNWYLNASPGPYFPCATVVKNGVTLPPINPPTFDTPVSTDPAASDATKLTYRNNNRPMMDLTPGTSYRCQTPSGELSWDATQNKLTISGTIFYDGSMQIQNGNVNTYTGQGVIYLTGSLLIKNSSMCGAVYNGACDTRTYQASPRQGWDPNSTLLVFVSGGNGGIVNVGDSIQLVSAFLQGAAYATNGLELGTTSNVDGPLVGAPVMLGQSVTTSFPAITMVPAGMPSNPTAYAQADSPTGYNG